VQVAHHLGWLDALSLLILVSIVGGWLVKRVGLGVARRVQHQLDAGRTPHRELLDGLLVLAAGVLLFVPGFITATAGLLLLLPPVRTAIANVVAKRLQRRIERGAASFRRGFFFVRGPVIDTGGHERGPGGAPAGRQPPAGAIDTHSVSGPHDA
jgi:UPF0716 protein FxsA